jgi:hypothetical protein
MANTYRYSRVEPVINADNKVIGFVVGLSATDDSTGKSAYIDKSFDVSEPFKALGDWTNQQIKDFCDGKKVDEGWVAILDAQITALNAAPTIGSNIDIND